MVTGRWRSDEVLARVRELARRHEPRLAVRRMPRRGKGSHEMWELLDGTTRVGSFMLTRHRGDLSHGVAREIETRLAPLFGDGWLS